ncbi:electron transport complex subunit RsxG [Alkalimonas delamerensis]|uniref:Ion-translocating oxidoreductase complex subunit G n=1 Tax=Alkalimonas delamerensis TaxID=265981 RepID=A0ABT9GN22_9GAMM|nr:electron transport complex subunit RsxG [Alkalimonas delamerensis]MDP4528361.1 electron transport complex subunit RsxG [Alkalimonas delamerensis]
MNPIGKNALLLALIAVICVLLLSVLNQLTAPRIAEQRLANRLALLHDVLPAAQEQQLLHDCVLISAPEWLGSTQPQAVFRWREQGEVSAYVVETTAPDGYSGAIDLMVAIAPDGTVLAARTLAHQETPGLGDKIELRKSNWMLGFNDKRVQPDDLRPWAVRKDGGDFDQFTGATITPRAVVGAVKRAALFIQQHPELADAAANCEGV